MNTPWAKAIKMGENYPLVVWAGKRKKNPNMKHANIWIPIVIIPNMSAFLRMPAFYSFIWIYLFQILFYYQRQKYKIQYFLFVLIRDVGFWRGGTGRILVGRDRILYWVKCMIKFRWGNVDIFKVYKKI